jgi:hypothetical protein
MINRECRRRSRVVLLYDSGVPRAARRAAPRAKRLSLATTT